VIQTAEISEAMQVQFSGPPRDVSEGFLKFLRESGAPDAVMSPAEEALAEARERLFAQETE
jgi:hypothetical protein